MVYSIITPLLFSVLIPVAPIETELAEVQESHTKYSEESADLACNCVAYARYKGADVPFVNASNIHPTTTVPYLGATAVFFYPHSGEYHIAIVVYVEDNYVVVDEANYEHCKTGLRKVFLNDTRLLGFL